jgi:hypothetical protein
MPCVQLFHWKEAEVPERLERLKSAGFSPSWCDLSNKAAQSKSASLPNAYVIDLSRLPSHGKAVAMALRQSKKSRLIPLVFVEGEAEKVAGIKKLFPDATYSTWRGIKSAIGRAIARPNSQPVVPVSESGAYSGTPLPKKLGLGPGSKVAILNAPKGFSQRLEPLPDGAIVRGHLRGEWDLAICFFKTPAELDRRLDALAKSIGNGGLWIAWPKKASGVATDLSEGVVRKLALAAGLVDYKVCAIDDVWSGLKFARNKGSRPGR